MRKTKSTIFYCFSPLVMVMTLIVEISLLLFVLLKGKKSASINLIAGLLLLLAVFQASEYGICEQYGFSSPVWAKVGFTAITLLPIFGLHLVLRMASRTGRTLLSVAYITALAWIAMFLFGGIMQSQVCEGNYVIFNLKEGFGGSYFIYYYFWLILASILALKYAKKAKSTTAQSLRAVVIGYATFTIPATLIWFLFEKAALGLPSIMCGFAVVFALILSFYVYPRLASKSKFSE